MIFSPSKTQHNCASPVSCSFVSIRRYNSAAHSRSFQQTHPWHPNQSPTPMQTQWAAHFRFLQSFKSPSLLVVHYYFVQKLCYVFISYGKGSLATSSSGNKKLYYFTRIIFCTRTALLWEKNEIFLSKSGVFCEKTLFYIALKLF